VKRVGASSNLSAKIFTKKFLVAYIHVEKPLKNHTSWMPNMVTSYTNEMKENVCA
jgi:hypothetical protein